LPFCLAVVPLILIVRVGHTHVPQRWEPLPFLVKEFLELDTREVDRCAGRVEGEAVPDHELKVLKELLRVRVLVRVQLAAHRAEIHRLLDDLGVAGDVELLPIYGLVERTGDRPQVLLVQVVEELAAEAQLLCRAVVTCGAFRSPRTLGQIGVGKVLRRRRMDLAARTTGGVLLRAADGWDGGGRAALSRSGVLLDDGG